MIVKEFKIKNIVWLNPEAIVDIKRLVKQNNFDIAINVFMAEAIEFILTNDDVQDRFIAFLKNKYSEKYEEKCPFCDRVFYAGYKDKVIELLREHLRTDHHLRSG